MPLLPCIAAQASVQSEALTSGELTFLKFLGIALMLLWAAYLIKELFGGGSKADPRVESLCQAVATMAAAQAASGARMEGMERRQNELIAQQRADTQQVFDRINELSTSIHAVLRDHEHEIAIAASKRP